ncbi:SGNH hydrolase-type esterase domain-containing protein [Ilyonectria destructans]|nr:SGNH hydrolase-type esterase domain-containing protein [Ilyonectria destructans]
MFRQSINPGIPLPHPSSRTQAKTTLRLMPLGGSVTYGVGSSTGNGYREFLRDMLIAKGYDIKLVGSRKSGSMRNNNNEGWRGYRLDQIENKARRSVETLLPNVFTINAGSNDCIQDFQIGRFEERMSNMLDYFWQTCPFSTVILSTLLVNADKEVNLRVLRVNEQIRDLVGSKLAEKKRTSLADMYGPEGPELGNLVDGTHPNDEGYRRMAVIWAEAVQKAHTE